VIGFPYLMGAVLFATALVLIFGAFIAVLLVAAFNKPRAQ